jgi:hypothetical protein
MHILIEKDSATKVPKQVKDLDEARAFAAQGHVVHVQRDDGTTCSLAEHEASLRPEPPALPQDKPARVAAKKTTAVKRAAKKVAAKKLARRK